MKHKTGCGRAGHLKTVGSAQHGTTANGPMAVRRLSSPTDNGSMSHLHSCETLRKGCETLCSHHCAVVKPLRNVCETLRNVCETLRNVRETYVNLLCRRFGAREGEVDCNDF